MEHNPCCMDAQLIEPQRKTDKRKNSDKWQLTMWCYHLTVSHGEQIRREKKLEKGMKFEMTEFTQNCMRCISMKSVYKIKKFEVRCV